MIVMTKTARTRLIIGAIAALVLLGGGFLAWRMSAGSGQSAVATPVPTLPPEPVNIIPVEQRPYARMLPSGDGRTVTLSVEKLNLEANEGEYEIEYQTGTVLQGAGGRLEVDNLPHTEDILLGSCSAGGKCSYHENVTGGQITLRLDDPNRYAVKSDWRFWENKERENTVSSSDGKLVLTGAGLARVRYGILFHSPGYPDVPPTKALSHTYTMAFAPSVTGTLTASVRLNEDVAEASLAVWDGTAWKVIEGTVADKTVTAPLTTVPHAIMAVSAE